MSRDTVQPLNYSAHAIEDILSTSEKLKYSAPTSSKALRTLAGMIEQSIKFILPNRCDLIDPDEFKQAHYDLLRLPYPCVTFEVPWEDESDGSGWLDEVGGVQQQHATKRIALCWEVGSGYDIDLGLGEFSNSFPQGGVFVLSVFWTQESKFWSTCHGGGFIPYGAQVRTYESPSLSTSDKMIHQIKKDAGILGASKKGTEGKVFIALPELFAALSKEFGSVDRALAEVLLNTHDEAMVLIQACSVINCQNVLTEILPASVALNKKRVSSGKQPFFSYKILQLSGDTEKTSTSRAGAGGSHAAPRMHLRRGHLRRVSDQHSIWVRPAIINKGSIRGVVDKDYKVS